MKQIKIKILFFSLLCIFSAMASHDLLAKSYQMSGLDVTIQIRPDGSMLVEEHREFTFRGRFSEVFRTFPVYGKGTFSQFRVMENGREYQQSESKSPGTFIVEEKRTEKELIIFVNARDTVRTFTIEFVVEGALEKYEDAVLLYYQIISDQWEQSIYNIRSRILPPEPLAAGEPPHWVHGSLEAVSRIGYQGVVEIELEQLPAFRYLELRALYPVDLFPTLAAYPGEIRESVFEEAAILTEEANWTREREMERRLQQEERHQTGRSMAIPLALVVLLVWTWFFRKYRSKPVIENKEEVFSQLPDKDLPALVSYMYFQTMITGQALASTLFHLASRGYITIKEEENPKKTGKPGKKPPTEIVLYLDRTHFEKNKHQLLTFESDLIIFLFDTLAKGNSQITMGLINKNATKMRAFFTEWKKSVTDEVEKKEWYDPYSKKGRNIGLLAGLLFMVAFGVGVAVWGPWMLIPLFMSLAFMVGSLMIYHRTEKGEIAYQRWKRIRKHLSKNKFDPETEKLDEGKINEYMVYGTALALGSAFYKKLFSNLELTHREYALYWIILHPASMSDFSNTVNKVITTTSTTMSSATGSGGGGTMGGGGGVSSGGGGAR